MQNRAVMIAQRCLSRHVQKMLAHTGLVANGRILLLFVPSALLSNANLAYHVSIQVSPRSPVNQILNTVLATCARIYACATAMLAQAKPKQSARTAFVRIRELVGQSTTVHSAVLDQICGYLAFLSAHKTVAQASRQTYPMPMAGNDSKMTHQIYLESDSGLDNYYEILSTSIL